MPSGLGRALLLTFAPYLRTCSAAQPHAVEPCKDHGEGDPVVLSQSYDDQVNIVAKVLLSGGDRLLVISAGQDFSSPCSYDWWMDHEVQGTITCEENGTAPLAKSFLQLQQSRRLSSDAAGCTACTPRLGELHGYFQTMAALSVLDVQGQPRSIGRTAVIGLGAGLLPSWYAARTEASVDVVDYSSAVVSVASCFGVVAGPKLALHVQDGRQFLADAQEGAYETMVVDAFDTHASMPVCMRSTEFFKLAASRLTGSGVLLLNLLTCASDDDQKSCGKFRNAVVASVQAVFPHTYLAEAPGAMNSQRVLLARKTEDSERDAPEPTGEAAKETAAWFKEAQVQKLDQLSADLAAHDEGKC